MLSKIVGVIFFMKNKIEYLKNKKINGYILAFIIPLILNIIIFSLLNIYPFGEEIYIRSDACEQYIRFFDFFKKNVYDGDFSQFLYSFSNGFGHGGMLFCAYYLSSPFNVLVLLFPFLSVEIMFMLIMMLKVAMLGLSFYYFLNRFKFNLGKASCIFSTAYSFTSFVTLYSMNIMWLDSLILLPFILVQLKKMFETKKIIKFTLAMFLLYLSNFYMAFMICLFVVILLGLFFLFDKESREDVFKKVKIFSVSIGISVLLFSFIMVPVLFELVEFYNTSGEYNLMEKISFSKIMSKFFLFRYDMFFSVKYYEDMTPYIYFGLFLFILSIIYALFVKSNVEKKIIVTIVLIILSSFMVTELNLMWHGFDAPTGFDYRYSFLLSFIGIVMSCEGFKYTYEKGLNKKEIIILSIIMLLIFLISVKSLGVIVSIINLFLVIFYIAIIAFAKNISKWKEKVAIIFVFEIILNAISLNMMFTAQFGIKNKDEYFNHKSESVIEEIVETYLDDNYRMLIEESVLPSLNTPIENRYKGVSSFNSSINFEFVDKLRQIGLYKTGGLSYMLESNYITDSIFAIKYVISERELDLYNKIKEIKIKGKKAYLYENPYALPFGFISENSIDNINIGNTTENVVALISNITGEEYELEKFYKKHYPVKITFGKKEILPNDKGDYILKRNDLTKSSTLKIEYPENLNLLVNVGKENDKADELLFKDDGKGFRNSAFYYNKVYGNTSFLKFKTYEREWDFLNIKSINLGSLEGLEWNLEYVQNVLEKINSLSLGENVDIKNGYVKMSVNAKGEKELFLTSIPYSNSWKAKINGKEVDLLKSKIVTLSLELEEGINEIELIYTPKGLKIGGLMTLVGVVFLIFYIKKV